MNIIDACSAIAKIRGDSLLVATMGAMNAFDALEVQKGRINSVPLMGGASCLGLGFALGNPNKSVLVVDGDSSLLMQLGSLVTIAGQKPGNLTHFVIDNRMQFSGGVNLRLAGQQPVDFCAIAMASGYARAVYVDSVDELLELGDAIHSNEGPLLVQVHVEVGEPRFGAHNPQIEMPERQFTRMGQEARELSALLRG